MCLSWHKFQCVKMGDGGTREISVNCCENLAVFLALLQFIGEKGGLRTHFSSFVFMHEEALGNVKRSIWGILRLSDPTAAWFEAILMIYATALVYPIGTCPPQGSVQQGSLVCEMVSLLPLKGWKNQIDRTHGCAFCLVSHIICFFWSWTFK